MEQEKSVVPILNSDNYEIWSMRIEAYLMKKGCWEAVEGFDFYIHVDENGLEREIEDENAFPHHEIKRRKRLEQQKFGMGLFNVFDNHKKEWKNQKAEFRSRKAKLKAKREAKKASWVDSAVPVVEDLVNAVENIADDKTAAEVVEDVVDAVGQIATDTGLVTGEDPSTGKETNTGTGKGTSVVTGKVTGTAPGKNDQMKSFIDDTKRKLSTLNSLQDELESLKRYRASIIESQTISEKKHEEVMEKLNYLQKLEVEIQAIKKGIKEKEQTLQDLIFRIVRLEQGGRKKQIKHYDERKGEKEEQGGHKKQIKHHDGKKGEKEDQGGHKKQTKHNDDRKGGKESRI